MYRSFVIYVTGAYLAYTVEVVIISFDLKSEKPTRMFVSNLITKLLSIL